MKSRDTIFHSPRLLTVIFSLLQVLKMLLSLVLVWMSARFFGAGVDREAWVVGWGAQMWLFKLLFTPVNESFRARFLQIREEKGEEEALRSFTTLFISVTLCSLVLIGLLSCFAFSFLNFIAPGYTGLAAERPVRLMTVALLPVLLLSEWTYLFTALLNCYRHFYLPELLGLLTIVLNLLLLYVAGPQLGIQAFVVANYTGLFLLFLLLLYRAYRMKLLLRTGLSWHRLVRFFGFAAPLYIAALAMQFNVWAERRLLSYLDLGSNAALDYARKFVDAPVIFVASLSTAVVAPLLSRVSGLENGPAFRRESFLFLRSCLLILTPAVTVCVLQAPDLIRMFLLHGRFDTVWEPSLVQALRWFGMGLPGTVAGMILGQIMIVRNKVNAYALVSVLAYSFPVLINYVYFRSCGLSIFALSWAICQTLAALVLLFLSGLRDRNELGGLAKLLGVCALSMVLSQLIVRMLAVETPGGRLLAVLCSEPLLLLLFLRLANMDEFVFLRRLWSRRQVR